MVIFFCSKCQKCKMADRTFIPDGISADLYRNWIILSNADKMLYVIAMWRNVYTIFVHFFVSRPVQCFFCCCFQNAPWIWILSFNCSHTQILIINLFGRNFHPNCIESVILTVECIHYAAASQFFSLAMYTSTTFLPCNLLYVQCKLSLQVKQTQHTDSHNK